MCVSVCVYVCEGGGKGTEFIRNKTTNQCNKLVYSQNKLAILLEVHLITSELVRPPLSLENDIKKCVHKTKRYG